MKNTNIINFNEELVKKQAENVFKEMEDMIIEYYFFYEQELAESGYTRLNILNDKNGAMTAMNTAIEIILREIYGDEVTDTFFDWNINEKS